MYAAIYHNNRGVAFLEKGCHEHALIEFKAATQLMYSFTQDLKKKELQIDHKATTRSQGESFTECIPSERPIEAGDAFICSTPLVMVSSEKPASSCSIESASILLNMALCYHLNSMRPNPLEGGIKNAVDLYQMAYGLAIQAHVDKRSQKIIMTSLNNLSQIKYDRGEFEAASVYLNDLSMYINYLGNKVHRSYVGDLHECMLNAMILKNQYHNAAAA